MPLTSTADIANAVPVADQDGGPQPTPDGIDSAIAAYEQAQLTAKHHQEIADGLKQQLVELVDEFGSVPAGAEQSKRLDGRRNTATITRGTTVSISEPGVAELGCYLADEGLFDLFPRFFTPQTKHKLVEGAGDVVKSVKLSLRVEQKILSLFGRSFTVKSNAPSLKVTTVEAEKVTRKPRGGKAAA